MYDITLQDCDFPLAKVVYNASSDQMRYTYGLLGVLLVHWFFPENVAILKRMLETLEKINKTTAQSSCK